MHSNSNLVLVTTIALSCLVFPRLAPAQASALEEIVVTAQKRAQSLKEVPISANVAKGEFLENTNLNRLQDFAARMPTLNVAESATGDQIYLRGVGSAVNPGFEQSVGTFLDGVYRGRDAQSRARFLDIERIEVLKGPQTTFFGNNTIGGALNITTRGPGAEPEGYVRAMYGPTDDDREIELAYGGPLTDHIGARAAFRWAGYDGFIRNATRGRNDDEQESFDGRLTLTWEPSADFDAELKVEHHVFHQNGVSKEVTNCPPGPESPLAGTGFMGLGFDGPFGGAGSTCRLTLLADSMGLIDFETDLNEVSHRGSVFFPLTTPSPSGVPGLFPVIQPALPSQEAMVAFDEFVDLEDTVVGLTLNWDVMGHTLTSVTAWTGYEMDRATDLDNLPIGFAGVHDPAEWDQVSQELRIASPTGQRLEYIAGVYYQHGDFVSDEILVFPMFFGQQAHTLFEQEEDSFSVFGALTWNVTDRLRGRVGLRYTNVQKDLDYTQTVSIVGTGDPRELPCADPGFFTNTFIDRTCTMGTIMHSREDDDLTPSVTLQYQWTDDVMTYFSFTQGFKAGGFDQRAVRATPVEEISFGPEEVDAFELGAKTTWLDGRLDLNLTLFRMEYTDLQVSSLAPNSVSGFIVTNAASAISQGVELDTRWALGNGLTLRAALSYLDGTFDEWRDGPCNTVEEVLGLPNCDPVNSTADRSGDDLPFAPDFSGNFILEYLHNFAGGFQLDTQVMVGFTTEVHHRIDNHPLLVEEGFAKVDANLGLSRGPLRVAVIGKNLTDEVTTNLSNRLVAGGNAEYRQRDRDRHFLIQANYQF